MNVQHIATIQAYEIKSGGFRGVYRSHTIHPLGDTHSDVLPTLDAAKFWAKTEAYNRHAKQPGYNLAAIRRKGAYLANVWINA